MDKPSPQRNDLPIAETWAASPETARTAMTLLAAALTDGPSRLLHATFDGPVRLLADALSQLGVVIAVDESADHIDVTGHGGHWVYGDLDLDCGHHPVASCLLLAACSLGRSQYRLQNACTDSPSTQSLIRAMSDLGLRIHTEQDPAGPVIQVGAPVLRGGQVAIGDLQAGGAAASLLLVAACATGDVFLQTPRWPRRPSEVVTALSILEAFGIAVIDDQIDRLIIPAPQALSAGEYDLQAPLPTSPR
jgi:5-enolpyruvylshikimate-3-phosphate synthase